MSDMNESENNQVKEETIESIETTQTLVVEAEEAKSGGSTNTSETFIAFTQALEQLPDAESKLKLTIDFMEQALSQENGVPQFKNFWDARDICLKQFKEGLSHQAREIFWARYSELSREARRLKDILDEQSAFAVEQIEIAITALEQEIISIESQLKELPALNLEIESVTIAPKWNHYSGLQNELNLLNTYAARVNAMRKELIKTDMRVRHKNRFFQRLSQAGDKIFPRRKELIAIVSETFVSDVDAFVSAHFAQEMGEPAFQLRDEIKALQSIAKMLTLNTHAFTSTRLKLSQGWDKVKEVAKERKKVRAEIQAEVRQNLEVQKSQIDQITAQYNEGAISAEDAAKQLDQLNYELRRIKLGRDEVKYIKDLMRDARTPIQAKIDAAAREREQELRQQEQKRREKFEEFKGQVAHFMESTVTLDADAINQKAEELRQQLQNGNFTKNEKREVELMFKPLNDIVQEKREQAMMNLSDDDQKAFQQLREILAQRQQRRSEIKKQLETLRKEAGNSGLDFEQAMAFKEQITLEKERLDKAVQGIEEIEAKIEELESKVY
jgi:hypothetical protein